jgi:hypothetical protein
MRGTIARTLLLGTIISGVWTAVALSAPTSLKPPTISGSPTYTSVLTCHKGTWSPGAVSFDYTWVFSGGGPTIVTGPQLRVRRDITGYVIACVVTAHDAQGQTTSATSGAVTTGPGISTVKITRATAKKGRITISGVAGPTAALARAFGEKPYVVLDQRLTKTTVQQLGSLKVVTSRQGRFTLSAPDSRGRHTFVVNFVPTGGSSFNESSATRRLNVK